MLLMNRREIRNFEAECLQNGDWRGQMRRDRKKVIWLLLQVLISAWAIQGQALTEISWEGYLVDIPVIDIYSGPFRIHRAGDWKAVSVWQDFFACSGW